MALNKTDLIDEIAKRTGSTKVEAAKFYDAFQGAVTDTVAKGEEVKLTGFLAINVSERAPRTVVSLQTGKPIDVPATKVVRVRPLTHLKDAVKK